MIKFAPAKINLGLAIQEKRADGFHEITSFFYPIPLFDVVEIVEAKELTFQSFGLSIDSSMEDNLVVKAYRLLESKFALPPVAITLQKNIPMGAGLGGGSSDATQMLKLLNEKFALNLSSEKLREYAAELGSDCAFFVEHQPQLAKGRGELLQTVELDLSAYYLQVINPGIHIGTKEAYAGVSPQKRPNIEQDWLSPIGEWKKVMHNDFEDSVFPNHPAIMELKQELYNQGAVYASMSGSGSTVFGLFRSEPKKMNKKGCVEFVLDLSKPIY